MALYVGPKCRLCRREGVKLYLKGARCESEKCALSKRSQAPGQHGTSRKALSGYGLQLREKQKAKRIYGLLEKQFKRYVTESSKTKGMTAQVLYQRLETRLDNLVFRSGFAVSRSQARQFVRRGLILVNGTVAKTASQNLKVGDVLQPVSFDKNHLRQAFVLPDWLSANVKEKNVKVIALPDLESFQEKFDLQSIIEFYSR